MTQNRNLKRRVRARAAKTGESYTAALKHVRQATPDRQGLRTQPRFLRFSARSWLATAFDITDETGEVRYVARRHPGFLSGTWSVVRGAETVAVLSRRSTLPRRACLVEMEGTEFLIKNRFGFSRVTEVHGGSFDGAVLTGGFFDLKFRLEHRGALLAEAKGRLLAARDRFVVRLARADDPAAEALAVVMIMDTLIQRSEGN